MSKIKKLEWLCLAITTMIENLLIGQKALKMPQFKHRKAEFASLPEKLKLMRAAKGELGEHLDRISLLGNALKAGDYSAALQVFEQSPSYQFTRISPLVFKVLAQPSVIKALRDSEPGPYSSADILAGFQQWNTDLSQVRQLVQNRADTESILELIQQ